VILGRALLKLVCVWWNSREAREEPEGSQEDQGKVKERRGVAPRAYTFPWSSWLSPGLPGTPSYQLKKALPGSSGSFGLQGFGCHAKAKTFRIDSG
jgi:hypothetical protein